MPRVRLVPAAIALVVALVPAADAAADAVYVDLPEALDWAEVVALVRVESVGDAEFVGDHWVYSQLVIAHPLEVLAGELPDTFTIVAGRNFVCAPVRYDAPGTYLVMLARDRGMFATINNEMGRSKVFGDRIDWAYDELVDRRVPLAPVLADLRARLASRIVEPPRVAVPAVEVPMVEVPVAEVVVLDEPPPPAVVPAIDETPRWLVPASMFAGAFAVLLGFGVAGRKRRRRSD